MQQRQPSLRTTSLRTVSVRCHHRLRTCLRRRQAIGFRTQGRRVIPIGSRGLRSIARKKCHEKCKPRESYRFLGIPHPNSNFIAANAANGCVRCCWLKGELCLRVARQNVNGEMKYDVMKYIDINQVFVGLTPVYIAHTLASIPQTWTNVTGVHPLVVLFAALNRKTTPVPCSKLS